MRGPNPKHAASHTGAAFSLTKPAGGSPSPGPFSAPHSGFTTARTGTVAAPGRLTTEAVPSSAIPWGITIPHAGLMVPGESIDFPVAYKPPVPAAVAGFDPSIEGGAVASEVCRLAGLLFARPESRLAKDEVLPHLNYFSRVTADKFNFYCVGYHIAKPGETVIVQVDGRDWAFSVDEFVKARNSLMESTKWKYSGGVDLVLCNESEQPAASATGNRMTRFDFGTTMALRIQTLLKEDAITSFESFFEDIVDFAETNWRVDPAWDLSDRHGIKLFKEALKEGILSLLPEPIRKPARKAFLFTAKDLTK